MEPKPRILLLGGVLLLGIVATAQGPAALGKMRLRYDVEQIEDMRVGTPYKYHGLLLYYSSSFLVLDNDQYRAATEDEITAVDLGMFDALRTELHDVTAHDDATGMDLLLLSKHRFEQLLLGQLGQADRSAYLANKNNGVRTSIKGRF